MNQNDIYEQLEEKSWYQILELIPYDISNKISRQTDNLILVRIYDQVYFKIWNQIFNELSEL